MNISGYPKRIIIAILVCAILVFLLAKIVEAFLPGVFSAAQMNLIQICIWIAGFLYVIWGETWFGSSNN